MDRDAEPGAAEPPGREGVPNTPSTIACGMIHGKGLQDNRGRHIAKGHAGALKHARWALWKEAGEPGRPSAGQTRVQRCRIGPFVELGRSIRRHRQAIDAALEHRLSNTLAESVNTKIRLITRLAFGFRDPAALFGLAVLSLGGYGPPLPGR